MRYIRGLFYAALFSLALASPGRAQNESCQHRTVTLSVYDSAGRTVSGLTPADFEAKYRGQPVKILSIVPDNRPHRVVILLDASGSMKDMWGAALAAAVDLAETPLPNTQVALIIFTEKIQEQIDFSLGQGVVAERLRQIRSNKTYTSKLVEGRTALYDAMLSGLGLLADPTSADSIYLVSDAGDNASHASLDRVNRALTFSGVRLFLVYVFQTLGYRNRTPEELNGPSAVDALVRGTGGEVITPYRQGAPTNSKESAQISRAMKDFYRRMTKNDLMEIDLPLPVDKHENWELKFSPEKKKQFKGGEICYPTSLAPCGP